VKNNNEILKIENNALGKVYSIGLHRSSLVSKILLKSFT